MIPASGESLRLAIFTICSNNYMPFAQVLFASLRRHHPDAALFLCLADRLNDTPGSGPRDWTVIEANDLPIPDFAGFAFRYDIMEFNTALKPFMFLHLLEARGFDAVVYLDPDIELFAPLAGVLAALQSGASFVFTPHLCAPSEHRAEPNDLSMMRAGAYNLGFLAVSRCEETVVLLGWWARRLRTQCVNAQAEGLFVDQKFMDLIPSFASNAAISHDTTLNVAYWNLEQRTLDRTAEGWTVDGAPLTFFHFSGFNPRLPHRLSRHSPRFVGDLPPPLAALTAQYAERLWMQGHGSFPGVSYTYGRFASGTPIHPVIRAMFRDQRPAGGGDPFVGYEAYLDEAWPDAVQAAPGHVVTNLMGFLQGIVPPLSGLDPRQPHDAERLVRWFATEAAGALCLDPALVAPAAIRLGEGRPAIAAIPGRPGDSEMEVTVTAPLRTGGDAMQCGRLTFHALLSAGVAVELRDDGCQEGADGVPVRITCLSGDRMADALPAAMSAQGGGFRILVPAWDLACFPAPALSTLGLVHEVWAPSRFIQIALAGHTDRPVIHMPLAIEPEPVAALPRSAFGLEEGRFAFLAWFDGRSSLDRTDPRTAIRAFRQAFPRRGRASLVLASHDGAVPPEQRPGIDAAIDGDPDIVLLDRTLTAADRQSLTAACDALLSLHRSEGLALATARAMLLDRPVIAPDYAASGEFVTARTGYPVEYRLVPVDGSCLAEIDASHAAWIMASLADDPRQADPLVARAHAQVRHLHGREAVAARQQGRLRALSRRPEQHDAG